MNAKIDTFFVMTKCFDRKMFLTRNGNSRIALNISSI